MGVDAEMYAVLPRQIDDDELARAAGRLAATIGRTEFWITRPEKGAPQHALYRVTEEYEQDKIENGVYDGHSLIGVSQMHRYYGEGYERGPWPVIRDTLNCLAVIFPTATLHYGGDSGEYVPIYTAARRDELNAHFYNVGHEPYRGYRGSWETGNVETCDFCGGRPMHRTGGGGSMSFWHCDGCGLERVTNPRGNREDYPPSIDDTATFGNARLFEQKYGR